MSEPIGIGLLGLGRIGRLHATNILTRVPAFTAVGAADPYAENVATELGIPYFADWKALVASPDVAAVLISSPTEFHTEQIVEAARQGKHVLCEKPIDRTLDALPTILRAVDEAGIVLQVGFNRRADHNFAQLRHALTAGAIGDPLLVKITSRDPAPAPISYLKGSGGLFLDMAIHDYDMARYLVDSEVVSVSATGSALLDPEIAAIGDIDTAVTTVTFANGVLAVIDNCRQASYGYDQRVEVHGTTGMLLADNEQSSTVRRADAAGYHTDPLPNFFLDRYGAAYVREMEAFAAAVAGTGKPIADAVDGARAVEMAVAAERSRQEGRAVRLDEVRTTS
jgi:myo-inositol 2-dehydrogenase / D-chiro-inositol 1-dehydrogenase